MADCKDRRRQPQPSASDLLERYIDQFEASSRRQPQQEKLLEAESSTPVSGYGNQAALHANPGDDAWTLLYGGSGGAFKEGNGGCHTGECPEPVSLRTRCILQRVDRKLGFQQPCYSTPENLDLRTLWPSMHQHLERRWRRQLAAQHEAQQERRRQQKAAAKVASSRADLYCPNRSRGHPSSSRQSRPSAAAAGGPCGSAKWRSEDAKNVAVDVQSDEDREDDDEEKSDDGTSLNPRGRTCRSDSSEDCFTGGANNGGFKRPHWGGSDSGVGLSVGVSDTVAMATAGTAASSDLVATEAVGADESAKADAGMALSLSPDHRAGSLDGSQADRLQVERGKEDGEDQGGQHWRSFDERMQSYRCVLEAHELSAQLRLSLEAACAATARPLKALSAVEKGRIRDRLTRLQGPLREEEEEEEEKGEERRRQRRRMEVRRQREEQEERITTERLSNLMVDARSLLLEDRDGVDQTPRFDRQSELSISSSHGEQFGQLSESESH